MKIKNTKQLVKRLLEEEPKTRNNDNLLYIRVIESCIPKLTNRPFAEVMLNVGKLDLPKFETVRRSRQYHQAHNPELQADEIVQDLRTELEMEYRKEFSK